MIKAIIFDCFGVLASDGWLPYKAKYFGGNPASLRKVTAVNRAVDAGKLNYDEFIREVAQEAGLSEAAARQEIENNIPDAQLFEFIKTLKPHYKIGLLSNAGDDWLADIFTPEQVALFDAVALSYEMGVIKPEPEAYATIAERLQVPASECVFVDDQPKYIEGAKRAGMAALLYKDLPQFRHNLEALLSNSSS